MAPLFPFIVLVIIVIAKAIGNASRQPGGPSAPRPAPTESERRRRFMEAMGLPADTEPPPAVQPRTVIHPPPLMPVKPPAVLIPVNPGRLRRVPAETPATPPPQPVSRGIPPAPPQPPAPAPAAPLTSIPLTSSAAPIIAGKPAAASAPQLSSVAVSLLRRLRDPASIREAIVLREVLGPPKAFQLGQIA